MEEGRPREREAERRREDELSTDIHYCVPNNA